MIYAPNEHLSIATLPGMRERTVTLNGFSKTYAMTGWRVGYLAAPGDFVAKVTEPRHTLSINTCTISQYAALAALTGPQEPVQAMLDDYAARRAWLMPALTAAGFTYGHPGGAFYIYTNIVSSGLAGAGLLRAAAARHRGDGVPRHDVRRHQPRLHPHQLSAAAAAHPRGHGPHRRLHGQGAEPPHDHSRTAADSSSASRSARSASSTRASRRCSTRCSTASASTC